MIHHPSGSHPLGGAELNLKAGQSVFTFHSGAVYLLSGQVRYKLATEPEPFYYTLGPGALLGLEQPHLPEGLLKATVLEPIQARAWSLKALEATLGKQPAFALDALLSLAQQQRRLTDELTRRLAAQKAGEAERLATLAEHNAQAGNPMAQVFYKRLVGTYPNHDITSAIREALGQLQKESRPAPGTGPLTLTKGPSHLSQETQISLYQLAFGGLDGLNQDVIDRFGRRFAPGETLFREGETGEELFLLLSGSVDVINQGQPIGQLYAGDLVGELAVLDGKTRTATIVAHEATQTLALDREQFQMIFQLHPSWTWRLIQGFSLRLANAYQLLA